MKKKMPTPQRLPSGMYRCQITVNGRRMSVTDEDPHIAQAKAVALKAGIIEREEKRKVFFSLEDAIEQYITDNDGILSPATQRGYSIIKRNRFPALMKENIYTITTAQIQEAIRAEARRLAPKTVKNGVDLVCTILKQYGNEPGDLKLPKPIKSDKTYMQPNEIEKFFAEAANDKHEIAIIFAVWFGMRRSEICGLCWDCVDFQAGTIKVRRKYIPGKDHRMILEDGAKTDKSQRTIHCPPYIMERLRSIRPLQPRPDQRVFPIHPDTLRRAVHRTCKRAGTTDSSVHGLRHTNAAVMNHIGIDPLHAMARGGWANETTYKKTYAYVFESAASDADTAIDAYFQKQAGISDP